MGGITLLFMIVETFKDRDPLPVYRRFRERGRLAPDGLHYLSSWVDDRLERCFQLMETSERRLLDEWMAKWRDLVELEVYLVMTSAEAQQVVEPRLSQG